MKLNRGILYFLSLLLILMILFGCRNIDAPLDFENTNNERGTEILNNEKMQDRSSDFTSPKPSSIHASPSAPPTIRYVELNKAGSQLNIRETPSLTGNIVGTLEHGDSVKVIGRQNGWAKIEFNQTIGYVNVSYLADEEPSEMMSSHESIYPDEMHIIVYKKQRSLELWNGDELVGKYNIDLGFNPIGHKEKMGDGKTPEGAYYICVKNPNSKYYRSLGLSYPGISDAERGLDCGLITQDEYDRIVKAINTGGIPPWDTPLGGQIMIHGSENESAHVFVPKSDWTEGCIAVDNGVMDILWEHCKVGTQVFIFP
ncbi:MAG: L,D-transpeptidase family protein [Clostridiales bacterium]|jgi:uncharacterized protein YraI|nr:L,D-transpeptidase family protein [Clostridiales bacterium]